MIKSLAALAQDLTALTDAYEKTADAWDTLRGYLPLSTVQAHATTIRTLTGQLDAIGATLTHSRRIAEAPEPPIKLDPPRELARRRAKSKPSVQFDCTAADEYERRTREEIAAAEAYDPSERSED